VTCRVRGASIDMDSAAEGLDDGSRFREALVQYSNLVRALLMRFYGYECKEPDLGNFTLCFCRLEDALAYCVTLQVGSSLFLSCLLEPSTGPRQTWRYMQAKGPEHASQTKPVRQTVQSPSLST